MAGEKIPGAAQLKEHDSPAQKPNRREGQSQLNSLPHPAALHPAELGPNIITPHSPPGCPKAEDAGQEAGIEHQAEKSAGLREAALLSRPAPGFQSWLLPADPSYHTSVGWVGKKPCSLAGCKQEHTATRHIALLQTPAAVSDAQASPSHETNVPWGGGDEK